MGSYDSAYCEVLKEAMQYDASVFSEMLLDEAREDCNEDISCGLHLLLPA